MRSMRRFGVALGLGLLLTAAATFAIGGASAAPATPKAVKTATGKADKAAYSHKKKQKHKRKNPLKIHVMGEWAHPDDDTSIIGPCGVWHQRYGIRCGIIMITRGEGGGNAVGQEFGPALGLRRENEDRVAHYRSGTVDIFNLDFVDFFYNQSAALSRFFWDHDELAAARDADHPHDPAGRLHRLHSDVRRRPRPPPGGRPLHLGRRPRGRRPDHVPRAAARAERARHVAGEEGHLGR